MQGDYANGINEETLERILVALQDSQSQELLYRINLILGHFSIDDMQALANIDPSIDRARQRLHNLLGVWVQRDTNNRLMISPLVKALGSQDLSISIRKRCHVTLGERIAQNELNQYKAFNAIFHFIMAETFDQAGTLLLYSLYNLDNSENHIDDGGLLSLWSSQPLPVQMNLGVRLLIRSYQISLSVKQNKSIVYFLDDLDNLTEQVTEQESEMMLLLVTNLISNYVSQIGFLRINHYFQRSLHFLSILRSTDEKEVVLPSELPFESLIWSLATVIQTTTELEHWIDTLEHLTPIQLQRAFLTETAEAGCLLVAEKLWMQEADKPEINQDWQTVQTIIHKLVESSLKLGLELLWASAIYSEVIVIAIYGEDLPQAIELANLALARASSEPRIQFLLKAGLGRLLFCVNSYNDSVVWLTQALEQNTESYLLLRLYTLLRLSKAIADQEPLLAIQYAQQAVNLAQSSEEIPETELVRTLGELAIATWITINLASTFEIWDRAGEILLKYREYNNEWKELFVVYAHIIGYFSTLAKTDSPPNNIENGESYASPTRGVFLSRNPERINYYIPDRDCFLMNNLASFAEAVGNDERALAWSLRGIESARSQQKYASFASFSRNIIPQLVLANRYAEVVDLAIEAGRIMVALKLIDESGGNILEAGIDIESVFESGDNQIRQQAESFSLTLGMLPIIFHIADLLIHQPQVARNKAIDLVNLCSELSATGENQSLWIIVTEILEQIYLQQSTCVELISRYKSLISPDAILPILGLMAATLQENAPVQEVLKIHLCIIEQVQKLTNYKSTTWRKIILPYFFNFWGTSVKTLMFRFDNPQMVAHSLYQVRSFSLEQQGQAILNIISQALLV